MALFDPAVSPALDSDGAPISGATWNFYLTGTTTPAAVFADVDLITSLGATVTADSAGRFADMYLDDTVEYRAILKDAGGATIKDIDPVSQAVVTANLRTLLTYGAIGDGTTNDTAAIQSALDSGLDIIIPAGYTFLFNADVIIDTNWQRFGGPGVLKPSGNCGVVVNGGATGVELDLGFNSAAHNGIALKLADCNRVIIHRLNGADVLNALYMEEVNTVTVAFLWATCRGYGIKLKGSDALRSDVIHFDRAVVAVASTEYGFDWDGNIHTVTGNIGIVGGKGAILRDTSASADPAKKPAIGRLTIESDYSTADGIRIDVGLDIDLIASYALGATLSGLYVGASVNDREVRVHGGKFRGNTRYGIENAGGVVLYSADADLQANTIAATTGNVWTEGSRFALDSNSYWTLSASNPLLVFDANDYMVYDRAANTLRFFVASGEAATITADGFNIGTDKRLALPASSASSAPVNFGEGVAVTAPDEGDLWLEGNVFKYRAFGVTNTLSLLAASGVQTQLITGGQVVWESGLTFRVSAAQYYINGQIYDSAEQTVTLAAADGSNPRIDVIYVDTTGTANDITGSAAASPSEPDVDPSTQLKLTFVLVGAALSAPAGVSNENIYLENTEWTGTTSGAGWTLGSVTDPYAGTTHIQATAVAANGYVSLDHGAAITLTDADVLQLFIKPTVAFPASRVLRVQWYNNGVALGTPLTVASGYWGFNGSTLAYQLVAIPMPNFVLPTGTLGDQLRITVVGGALSFRIDNIVLQTQGDSVPQTPSGGITQAQADARYLQLSGGTLTGDLTVPDEAYDATAWNGSLEVPTKNAIRDKIETLVAGAYTDEQARDAVGTALTDTGLVVVTVNDGADTIDINVPAAVASDYRTGTDATKALTSDAVWDAADYVTLNDSGGNIAVDMSAGFNFAMTMDGDYTLSNPTNTKNGQTGAIVLTQDGTGTQTLAYGSNWKFAGGTDPTLSTAAGAVDVLFYQVISSTVIVGNLVKAIA
jgi:hypothetical protein